MQVQHSWDEPTGTLSYVVHDGHVGIVIDPVRDYTPAPARTSWAGAERIARYIDQHRLDVAFVVDTHAHADHLSGMPLCRERYGAKTVTGARVGVVQAVFRDMFNLGADFPVDGSQFDVLLDEGDELAFGSLRLRALHTPGHTPAHMSWQVGGAVFLGDLLFAPDYGTARCDFPGGSAEALYDSVQRIYRLPDDTTLYLCHDYRPGGRALVWSSTVAEQKARNVQLDASTSREAFIAFRNRRDEELDAPALLLPSLQVNARAGELPEPDDNGVRYLRIPLDRIGRRSA